MKQFYEEPQVEVVEMEVQEIIAQSPINSGEGDETPWTKETKRVCLIAIIHVDYQHTFNCLL